MTWLRNWGVVTAATLCLSTMGLPEALAQDFPGWEGMRVIRQQGAPSRVIAADLNANGRDDIIVVDTRQSRLLVYRWLDADKRRPPVPVDPDQINDLPMAPEFERDEIPITDLPHDALAADITGDGKLELIVLTAPPNRVHLYAQNPEARERRDRWKSIESWDLEDGNYTGRTSLMLLRKVGDKQQLLISLNEGIQSLMLEDAAKAAWLSPRERRGRVDWWLADVNGNGHKDLIEWTGMSGKTVHWMENRNGNLTPSQTLFEEAVMHVEVLNKADGADLLILPTVPRGTLRRYTIGDGDESPVGQLNTLPISPSTPESWTGIKLGDDQVLAYVDTRQPRLLVHAMTKAGWGPEQTYPMISNIQAVAAPASEPGTLLVWARDASDLHISRWDGNRLTYPKLWPKSEDVADRKILTLRQVGPTIWWAQKVGNDLDLYVWDSTLKEPDVTRFEGLGNADSLAWLGGPRLLVMERFARTAKLAVRDDEGKVQVTEPGHLARANLAEFVLFGEGKDRRLGKLTDGVLQWLGDDLHPEDQVMLPDGQRLAGFLPQADGTAWALEQGGARLHRLEPDNADILRVKDSFKLNQTGARLMSDPVLGMLLADDTRVVHVTTGKPRVLELAQSIETESEQRTNLDQITVSRLFTTDVDGQGSDNVLLVDDQRKRLTLLSLVDAVLTTGMAWQVFEDREYPYGGGGFRERAGSEPRRLLSLDVDGDGHRDLLLLCHDRLLIYLAREAD